ncbi:transcriptional repressor LexA [Geobacter sp.]|uniref:transcriptional repressor LexA n=1 Tax=Geobacter sp. TaxID=46610 RepID=UPI0027BAE12D|nr:transcriptional repressor LexA [Geobacter sp.]
MDSLPPKQKQVFDFVSAYIEQHGCPPTLREISQEIGTKGTATAMLHLSELEKKGFIQRREGSRGIALSKKTGSSVSVPIVGVVRAGTPELATEDILGFCQIDASWLSGHGNFILRVKGESMRDAGIFDGDYAIIRPQVNAENGEIVVALINGEATLKRFYREHDHIRLQPENISMQPIIVRAGEAETMIAGKLLKTVRFFD